MQEFTFKTSNHKVHQLYGDFKTIGDVKPLVEAALHIPAASQMFVWGGKKVPDDFPLAFFYREGPPLLVVKQVLAPYDDFGYAN